MDRDVSAGGAATAREALEALRGSPATPLPPGVAEAIPLGADRVEFRFIEGEQYTGSAVAVRYEGGWFIDSAEICE